MKIHELKRLSVLNVLLVMVFLGIWGEASPCHAGQLAHLPLDEVSGTTAYDTAGSYNGTVSGNVQWGDGFYFDGSTRITISKLIPYDGDEPHSWSVYIKHSMGTPGTLFARTVGGWIAGAKAWSVRPTINYNNYGAASIVGASATNDNEWHHVVFVYNGLFAKIYVDGELEVSAKTDLSVPTDDMRYPLVIGNDGAAGGYVGWMKDVRVYNHALTLAEIHEIRESLTAPAVANKPKLYHLDIRDTISLSTNEQYDLRHVAACLQGLVNRQAPRLFVSYNIYDLAWLERLQEDGGFCTDWPLVEYTDIRTAIAAFRPFINGVVLYDPDPSTGAISTSLVATTVAGAENCLAVRKDTSAGSMYNYLVNDPTGPQLPVVLDLAGKFTGSGTIWQTSTPSSGSAKCDAYIWAKQKYIDTGKLDTSLVFYTLDLYGLDAVAGHPDSWQLQNLDAAVSNKAFCFELSPWGDEKPNDDPGQPLGADLNTFKLILDACNSQNGYDDMIKFCGFTNWQYKYTSTAGCSHGDVETEWETLRLQTAYNCYGETDAPGQSWVANASFYMGFEPLREQRRYTQNRAPSYEELQNKGYLDANGNVVPGNYIMLSMSDYDSPSWVLYWLAGARYLNSFRGKTICNWSVTPHMGDRASVAMDYMYRHRSAKDYFMSCVGYVLPTMLYGTRSPSGYASAVDMWQEHNEKYYRWYDYSICGWLLNGAAGVMTLTDAVNHAKFAGDGVGMGLGTNFNQALANRSAALKREPYDNPAVGDYMDHSSGVHFGWYRTIIYYPINIYDHTSQIESSGNNRHCLDMYSFYYLFRHHLGGNNNYRATWIHDDIPRIMQTGQTYSVLITVRNDGWDSWSESGAYRLGHAVVAAGVEPSYGDYGGNRALIDGGELIETGEEYTFSLTITAPQDAGNYELYYDMVQDGYSWFRDQYNIEWKKSIIVADDPYAIDTDADGCPDVVEEQNGMLYWHPDDSVAHQGDYDCDGKINLSDFGTLSDAWLQLNGLISISGSWDDELVDLDDFTEWVSNWLLDTY